MTDEAIRAAERTYRASKSPEDGDAWVQAVLRTTGVPITFLITETIQAHRALRAMAYSFSSSTSDHRVEAAYTKAMRKPVTPFDIVSLLRGGREWIDGVYKDEYPPLCMEPGCGQVATEDKTLVHPVLCWTHYCALKNINPEKCGITPERSVLPCNLPRGHEGSHRTWDSWSL